MYITYKLNRAAELLAEGKHTVSEIADITGFSTLTHFSKSFKKQSGVAHSDFPQKQTAIIKSVSKVATSLRIFFQETAAIGWIFV